MGAGESAPLGAMPGAPQSGRQGHFSAPVLRRKARRSVGPARGTEVPLPPDVPRATISQGALGARVAFDSPDDAYPFERGGAIGRPSRSRTPLKTFAASFGSPVEWSTTTSVGRAPREQARERQREGGVGDDRAGHGRARCRPTLPQRSLGRRSPARGPNRSRATGRPYPVDPCRARRWGTGPPRSSPDPVRPAHPPAATPVSSALGSVIARGSSSLSSVAGSTSPRSFINWRIVLPSANACLATLAASS